MQKKIIRAFGLVLILIGLVSCSSRSTPNPTATIQAPASTTNIVFDTPTKEATSTGTLAPTITIAPSPTYPPISTLTSEEAITISNIFVQDQECKLPCWNGLTPGVSSDTEIPGFFSRLGIDIQNTPPEQRLDGKYFQYGSFDAFPSVNPNNQPLVTVEWENGVVTSIEIDWFSIPSHSSFGALESTIGRPDSIVLEHGGGEGFWYGIFLQYNNFDLWLYYSGFATSNKGVHSACINGDEEPQLIVYITTDDLEARQNLYSEYRAWGEQIGLSDEDVFNLLVDKEQCVRLPIP